MPSLRHPFLALFVSLFGAGVVIPAAHAEGTPAVEVQELQSKGLRDVGMYIAATNRRGPMLATCFGSREALEAAPPFEAYLEIAKDGTVQLVSLQSVREGSDSEVDDCLMSQLNKLRYPEADTVISLRVTFAPARAEAPPPERAPRPPSE